MAFLDLLTDCLDKFTVLLGPALILIALVLIGFCTLVYFQYIVWSYDRGTGVGLTVVGIFILINVLYNYYKAVRVSPGLPPLAVDAAEYGHTTALSHRLRQYERLPSDDEDVSPSATRLATCKKCSRIRPPRTHHCSICKSCIYRYDHHCPWIYNCVGLRNVRFFYLFIFYAVLVVIFFISVSLPLFLEGIERKGDLTEGRPSIVMSFVLAAAVGVALVAFLAFHTYLLLTNQTTMEWATGGVRDDLRRSGKFRRNPYDLGRTRNWQQIFGRHGWRWAFPYLDKSAEVEGGGTELPVFPTLGVHNPARGLGSSRE